MGKMLDIPECDEEADMYPELSSELSGGYHATTWHGSHCILRRAGPHRCSISPLIIMDQHQGSHTQRYLEHRPARYHPGSFDKFERQNGREACQDDARKPGPRQKNCGEAQEHPAHTIPVPDRLSRVLLSLAAI